MVKLPPRLFDKEKVMKCKSLLSLAFTAALGLGNALAADREAFITDLHNPVGMIYDTQGALYIAEWRTARVGRYDSRGNRTIVTTSVGRPSGLALDENGTLFIASYDQGVVYTLVPGREPRVLASGFSVPAGLLWSEGILYVANRDAGEIVAVRADGSKEIVSRGHNSPVGIARFRDGNLIISCLNGGIDRIDPNKQITTVNSSLRSPAPGIVQDGEDAVLVWWRITAEQPSRAYVWTAPQQLSRKISTPPVGLARTPDGRLLVADWGQRSAFTIDTK